MKVQIENYLEILSEYKSTLFIHGIENIMSNIDRNDITKFGLSSRMFYFYRNGERAVNSDLFRSIINTSSERKILLKNAFDSFTGISSNGNSSIRLPKFYSPKLAYLTGFIIGDGHVSKRSEIVIWEETEKHSRYICNLIKNIFGYNPIILDEKSYYRIIINSAPIHFFFTKIIKLAEGKKKLKERIPDFIFLDSKFTHSFLRGIFDSDGGVTISKNKKSVLLSSANDKFLTEINLLLNRFDINFPGPYKSGNRKGYEIRTFKSSEIKKFNQKIGFLHPVKSNRANALVA